MAAPDSDYRKQLWQDRNGSVLTDMRLYCGKEKEPLLAHRCVLSASSPTFRELILNPAPGAKPGELHLPDFSAEQFLPCLEYIYLGSTVAFNTPMTVVHGLYAAHKYVLQHLQEQLRGHLKDTCSQLDAAVDVLELSNRLPEDDEAQFVKMAAQTAIFQLDDLLDDGRLTFDVLDKVIGSSDLEYRPPEIELFHFLEKWATAFCVTKQQELSAARKREALGTIINKMFFLDINDEDLIVAASECEIFIGDELMKILTHRKKPRDDIFFKDGERSGLVVTKQQFLAQPGFSEDDAIVDVQPRIQREKVEKFKNKPKVVGDKWFILPAEWYAKWEQWCDGSGEKPSSIQLSDLVFPKNKGLFDGELKREPGVRVLAVCAEVWQMLKVWFEVQGEEISRNVIEVGDEPQIEFVNCWALINELNSPSGSFRTSDLGVYKFSRASSIHQLEADARRRYNIPSCKNVRFWLGSYTKKDKEYYFYIFVKMAHTETCGLLQRMDAACPATCGHPAVKLLTSSSWSQNPVYWSSINWFLIEVQNEDGTWIQTAENFQGKH